MFFVFAVLCFVSFLTNFFCMSFHSCQKVLSSYKLLCRQLQTTCVGAPTSTSELTTQYRLNRSNLSEVWFSLEARSTPTLRRRDIFQIELFHEQLPLPVPCYDLVPVTELTLGPIYIETSGTPGSLDLTGGEYKT